MAQAGQITLVCHWESSCYRSSRPSSRKRELAGVLIRFIGFETEDRKNFNFCKHHFQAVEIFKKLLISKKLFDESKSNFDAVFELWCFAIGQVEKIRSQLYNYVDRKLEFVSNNSRETANQLLLTSALKTRGVDKC
ncbi:hypothetical protein NIES2111_66700 (plasmid) [Nostoc sp. NIES-2111]|nr:hypothetical protein NIES2111_66700 [Nostoc sp. NIES-2111]